MSQREIPAIIMRGGTSRGLYFNAADLPADRDTLAAVLIAAMGAGTPLQVDGLGGGQPTTSKVAMLSPSADARADIDFFFAQVHACEASVDFSPSCGNILAGVGPAGIEMGMVPATDGETRVRIRNTNTDSFVNSVVQTPGGMVEYAGGTRIDGVPGTAAPVLLDFMDVVGSKTGRLFPTGRPRDVIDGVPVTCIDVAVPMVIARAESFGLSGYESRDELDANTDFFARLEPVRIAAGERMGLGAVSKSVVPKVAVLAAPRGDGTVAARYFMPWKCHPTYAVTGSICTGAALLAPGTVADGLVPMPAGQPTFVRLEHPSGFIDVQFRHETGAHGITVHSAGLIRTARKIGSGTVCIPAEVWR